jgi:hypothetical protein
MCLATRCLATDIQLEYLLLKYNIGLSDICRNEEALCPICGSWYGMLASFCYEIVR